MKKSELVNVILASNNGDENAKVFLAKMYYLGDGVNKDTEQALKLFYECIDNNNLNAIITLASLYILDKKLDSSIPLLEKGVSLNDGECAYLLFTVYDELNNPKCLDYLNIAVDLNFQPAIYTKAMMTNDNNKKIELLEKAPNITEAKFVLATMYLDDDYQNYPKALKLLKEVARLGFIEAYLPLAAIYLHGLGVSINKAEAARYTKLAADNGFKDAYYNLALMYLKGEGVKKSPKDAFHYMRKAAYENNIDAKHNLACMYLNGQGVKKDIKEGLRLLEYCAQRNDQLSIKELAKFYLEIDPEKALYYQSLLTK